MKYDLKAIMTKAWELFRKATKAAITFSEALRRAWAWAKAQATNAAKIAAAAIAAGITDEYHTWYGWKMLGREVIHESKAVFQVVVDTPEKGIGKTFKKSFFTLNQTAEIEA